MQSGWNDDILSHMSPDHQHQFTRPQGIFQIAEPKKSTFARKYATEVRRTELSDDGSDF